MTIDDLIKELNKKSNLKITTLADDDSTPAEHSKLSTGCLPLDSILGGGLPVRRITEIFGEESTGKSLIAAQVVATAQEQGYVVLYLDTESAVSKEIMAEVGVDVHSIMYSEPETIDGDKGVFQAMENAIDREILTDRPLLIVWDTIAATSTVRELKEVYGKAMMGQHAQLISQGLRKIRPKISRNNVTALFVNQTKKKIGVMYGNDKTTFGGKAISYHSSVRIELIKEGNIIQNKRIVGTENTATVIKSKVCVPFGSAVLPIYFGHGIDDALASFEFLKTGGLLQQSGAWYEFEGNKFQRKNWSKVFDENFDRIAEVILGEKS